MSSPPRVRWVDLHVHYLPGVDDGPATFDETLAMLRLAHETGSRAMVATPHLYSVIAESLRPEDAKEAFERTRDDLLAAARRHEHAFLREMTFHEGAENHLGTELLDALEQRRAVTLDRTQNVLVELPPFMPYEPIARALGRMIGWGYVPVLAHVERYPLLMDHPELLRELRSLGCLAQVNAGSVAGNSGHRVARQALQLLQGGVATVIASDGHDVARRPPDLRVAATALASRVAPDRLSNWLSEAPGSLLRRAPGS